jgi:hypothetical protein
LEGQDDRRKQRREKMRDTYVDQADGLSVGDEVTVALKGKVEQLRKDSDGIKVCLRGSDGGFYIWITHISPDVSFEAQTEKLRADIATLVSEWEGGRGHDDVFADIMTRLDV